MTAEINKTSSVRLPPDQEFKMAPVAGSDLTVGQILKTVVVTPLSEHQVLLHINGQNMSAKSSHHFSPGDILEVKVIATQDETILEVQHQIPSISMLQAAFLQALPMQAPATNLLQSLNQLMNSSKMPDVITAQIKSILSNVISVPQLSEQLMMAINQSGLFLESALCQWQRETMQKVIRGDFKGQCLKLLNYLPKGIKNDSNFNLSNEYKLVDKDPLPLPGAIPQPLHKDPLPNLLNLSQEGIHHILREQVTQVLARIKANQINHLTSDNQSGYLIMLDLPIKTMQGYDVIPLMIKQHPAQGKVPEKWSMAFAMSLSKLGDIQATVSLSTQIIDIKINTDHAMTLEKLNSYQKEMSQVLRDLGFILRDWKLQLGLEKNQIDVNNLRLLDIRI